MTVPPPRVTAVVLAYLDEPWVERCVRSVLASEGVQADVALVDNGCTTDAVERLRDEPGVTVVTPAENLGFAGGCNAGAAVATGEFLALVNADAVVRPQTLRRLVEVVARPGVGIACGSIRLSHAPDLLNSAGNPLHVLGLSWAGGFEEPAAAHDREADVAVGSGAGLVMRRATWNALGGFAPEYFAYHEDTELSWRCWQLGLSVRYVPDAVVEHRYEFSRNPRKFYLVERNRLLFLLTTFERRTLLLLLPPLVALEAAMLALGAAQGWLRLKVAGYRWLLQHRAWLRERRALVQSQRLVGDAHLAHLLTPRLSTTAVPLPVGMPLLNALMRAWWALVRRLIGADQPPG